MRDINDERCSGEMRSVNRAPPDVIGIAARIARAAMPTVHLRLQVRHVPPTCFADTVWQNLTI